MVSHDQSHYVLKLARHASFSGGIGHGVSPLSGFLIMLAAPHGIASTHQVTGVEQNTISINRGKL